MEGKVISIFKAKEATEEVKLDEIQGDDLIAKIMEQNERREQKKLLDRKDRNLRTMNIYNIQRRD